MSDARHWNRIDAFGAELALLSEQPGLHATGWALGAAPTPYRCEYKLETDAQWRTTSLEVTAEGVDWSRSLRLTNRPGGRDGWKVRASETGSLAGPPPGAEYPETFEDALDVDLGYSPLTNTLPIRRLALFDHPGERFEITLAWVEVPSLAVVASVQQYTALGPGRVEFRAGGYRVELTTDDAGYLLHYPGLATAAH